MNFELKGMKQAIKNLEAIRVETSGPSMLKALRSGGAVIRDAIRETTPVLDHKTAESTSLDPGALRDGIRVATVKDSDTPQVVIGPNSKVAHVARFLEYGHFMVHGGYSKLASDGKRRGPGQVSETTEFVSANPFIRRGFESSVTDAEAAIVASIRKSIVEQVK